MHCQWKKGEKTGNTNGDSETYNGITQSSESSDAGFAGSSRVDHSRSSIIAASTSGSDPAPGIIGAYMFPRLRSFQLETIGRRLPELDSHS